MRDRPSRLGQSQVINAIKALSLPRSRGRCGARSKGNIQLMPKKEILDFKPVWRLAQSGDKRRKQMEDGKHRAA